MRPENSDAGRPPPSLGKHRIQAEFKRLEQEALFLELFRVPAGGAGAAGMEKALAACREMIRHIESRPDPLLPETNGPINPSWDRFFEGPEESKHCSCWKL